MYLNRLIPIIFILFGVNLNAQQTGSFQTTIIHNGTSRILEYAVPTNYDSSIEYPLVVGLHGCVGGANPAANFRDDLAFLVDSIQAIVVCPNGPLGGGNLGATMDDPEHSIILAAIDSTEAIYNIDTTQFYLMGFSCNGYVTSKYGMNELKPWKGIIPFNAYFDNTNVLNDGTLEYENETSTCICIGSLDPNITESEIMRDSLNARGADYLYNEIAGVGHTTNFPTFEQEVMECMNFFEDNPSTANLEKLNSNANFIVNYPNPFETSFTVMNKSSKFAEQMLTVTIFNLQGKTVYTSGFKNSITINTDFESGTYILEIKNEEGILQQKSIIKK